MSKQYKVRITSYKGDRKDVFVTASSAREAMMEALTRNPRYSTASLMSTGS